MNKKYVYKPYNELFSKLFLEEKTRLLNNLNDECIDVEHIGSTAIQGLGGKGIIDIGITVAKESFDSSFHKDEDTWDRAKGWVLWKALITLEAIEDKTSLKAHEQLFIIKDVLKNS